MMTTAIKRPPMTSNKRMRNTPMHGIALSAAIKVA